MNAEEKHSLELQKHTLEQQRAEIGLALKELVGAEKAYRFVGGMLIEADATKLRDELTQKQESISVRLQSLAKIMRT